MYLSSEKTLIRILFYSRKWRMCFRFKGSIIELQYYEFIIDMISQAWYCRPFWSHWFHTVRILIAVSLIDVWVFSFRHVLQELLLYRNHQTLLGKNLKNRVQGSKYCLEIVKIIIPAIISAFLDSAWAAFSASSFANSALINSSLACFSNSLAILSCLLFSLA